MEVSIGYVLIYSLPKGFPQPVVVEEGKVYRLFDDLRDTGQDTVQRL
jgi:hypothetical protein